MKTEREALENYWLHEDDCLDGIMERADAYALAVLDEANAQAEADMLRGNPVEGAHGRAIQALRAKIERSAA